MEDNPTVRSGPLDWLTVEADLTGVWFEKAGDEGNQSGLARPRVANDGNKLSGFDSQIDVPEYRAAALWPHEALVDMPQFKKGHRVPFLVLRGLQPVLDQAHQAV